MKFMNMKRFASTVMAGVLTLSLAVPAMAVDDQTVITATYADIELAVTVDAAAAAQINPYGLPVQMGDNVTNISGQPITIATPLTIQNQSSVALKVGASVTTAVTGVTLETAANKGTVADGTAKALYVEFQAFEAPGMDVNAVADPTQTCPAYKNLKDSDAVLKAVLAASAVTATKTGTNDLVLREAAEGGIVQDGGVAFVRLSGIAAKNPTTAWADTDKFVATITYSFEPTTYVKSAGTLAGQSNATDVNNGGNLDVTLTPALPENVTVTDWTWASDDEAVATVAPKADKKVATVTNKLATTGTSDTAVNITVTGVGSDGITYSATIALNCKGNT